MKTNKSLTARLKITKNGKIKRRKQSQNHFNAKESSKKKMAKRSLSDFAISNKDKSRYLPKK